MMRIAIDGPSASGKSTIAKLVAEGLGFRHLDTGAMYRTVAALALRNGIAPGDADALAKMLREYMRSGPHAEGENSSGDAVAGFAPLPEDEIRLPQVNEIVSEVSSHPVIREALIKAQRAIAGVENIVMDGRDIGSVVLKDAELKIYLDASALVRARRRAKQSGRPVEEEMLAIERRDELDRSKAVGALIKVDDAVVIDTTSMSIDEVVHTIMEMAKERQET